MNTSGIVLTTSQPVFPAEQRRRAASAT